jgi:putative ABC transport system permease protein
MISHMTTRRTGEIGVRLALGATRSDVLRMFMLEGVGLALFGVVVGIPAVAGAGSLLLGPYLYGVRPDDPAVIGLTAVVIVAVSALAAALPARRAASVDPVAALREG